MGQSFCLFSSSLQIEKSVDGVLGIRTWGRSFVGADETTELWRPPISCILCEFLQLNGDASNFLSWLENLTSIGRYIYESHLFFSSAQNVASMIEIQSSAQIKGFNGSAKVLPFSPDVTNIFSTSENVEELEYYWIEANKEIGVKMRKLFIESIALINREAR